MPIIYYNRFASLTDFTLIQSGSTITASSATEVLHQTDTNTGSWNRIRSTLTTGKARAASNVLYCQFNVADISGTEDMMIMTFSPAVDGDFTGTVAMRATGDQITLYDDNSGNIGGFSETQNTWYDLKMAVSAGNKLVGDIRASNSVGNLPAGTGSYANIGTSDTSIPTTYFPQTNLKTLNPNTDLTIAELYLTTDGTFQPQVPTLLAASATGTTTIDLSFTDNGNAISETGIKVERSTSSGGTFAQVGTVAQGVGTYSDSGLAAGTAYYYKIRSYITISALDYNSAYTSEATATTTAITSNPGADLLALEEL